MQVETLEPRLVLSANPLQNLTPEDPALSVEMSAVAGDPQNGSNTLVVANAPAVVSSNSLAAVADFQLVDVNPTSTTYNNPVSPRDYLQQTSVYYFFHST